MAEAMEQTEVRSTKKKNNDGAFWTVGRRKEAIARVRLAPGSGVVTINDKPLEEVFASNNLAKARVLQPLAIVERQDAFDVSIRVAGGGSQAQLGAIALGIARALKEYDESLRAVLREHHLLTRDQRMKERKKYGLKRARKAPQFSKR
jgi:small subunit ribosomal protein S9